jgi:predicted transcriptional regulator
MNTDKNPDLKGKILGVLKNRPMSPGDISQILDEPLLTIIRALNELEEADMVTETPDRTDNLYFISK